MPPVKTKPKTLHKAMRYSVFPGGKRIRPVILIEAARACGAGIRRSIAAACAVEMIHSYSLAHDDLPSMDDDDFRRGKPSCHKKFGEANAILAGDALLTLAFNIMAVRYPADVCSSALKELSSAIGASGMVGGQALDTEISRRKNGKRQRNISTFNGINLLKTAKLFEASAAIGAIIARAGKKEINAMRGYGLNLGMAFQSVDDILDGEYSGRRVETKRAIADSMKYIREAKISLDVFGSKAYNLARIADNVLAGLGREKSKNDQNN